MNPLDTLRTTFAMNSNFASEYVNITFYCFIETDTINYSFTKRPRTERNDGERLFMQIMTESVAQIKATNIILNENSRKFIETGKYIVVNQNLYLKFK